MISTRSTTRTKQTAGRRQTSFQHASSIDTLLARSRFAAWNCYKARFIHEGGQVTLHLCLMFDNKFIETIMILL